jgi:hypothetical protein
MIPFSYLSFYPVLAPITLIEGVICVNIIYRENWVLRYCGFSDIIYGG